MSFTRSLDWRSGISLWQANIITQPDNAKWYQNLIAEAIIARYFPLAQGILSKAIITAPTPTYDYLEGSIHYMSHNLAEALAFFENAVHQDSNHIRSLLAIGGIYLEMGRKEDAARYYQRTINAKAPDGCGSRDKARQRLTQLEVIAD